VNTAIIPSALQTLLDADDTVQVFRAGRRSVTDWIADHLDDAVGTIIPAYATARVACELAGTICSDQLARLRHDLIAQVATAIGLNPVIDRLVYLANLVPEAVVQELTKALKSGGDITAFLEHPDVAGLQKHGGELLSSYSDNVTDTIAHIASAGLASSHVIATLRGITPPSVRLLADMFGAYGLQVGLETVSTAINLVAQYAGDAYNWTKKEVEQIVSTIPPDVILPGYSAVSSIISTIAGWF